MSKKANKNQLSPAQRQKQELKHMKQLDTTALKQKIYDLRVQLQELIEKKTEVQQQIAEENRIYMQNTYKLQQTIKKQQQEITTLNNNFLSLAETFDKDLKKRKQLWENQMDQMILKKKNQKQAVTKEHSYLKKKVQHIKKFKERQGQYEKTLQQLNIRLKQSMNSHNKDIQKIKQQHNKNRVELNEKIGKEIEDIQISQVNKLQSKMTKQQNIKKQNQIIQNEITLCQNEKNVLEMEYKNLMKQINSEKSATDQVLGGQASQSYQRSLRVLKLQGKLTKLRAFLNDQTERLDNEYEKMQVQYNNKQKQLGQKLAKLQSNLKLKERQNKKLKACAQMVLNQRSNLQSYLLEVFHEHPDVDYKQQRNINQILRYLFIKINSNKQPISYKNYLPSPVNSQVSQESLY